MVTIGSGEVTLKDTTSSSNIQTLGTSSDGKLALSVSGAVLTILLDSISLSNEKRYAVSLGAGVAKNVFGSNLGGEEWEFTTAGYGTRHGT